MPPRTVIIHGWSDQSSSFADLKTFLEAHGHPADGIYYGDWLSREDNISYDDVVAALNREFHARGFIDADNKGLGDLNVIVHSTGGLIIRYWLAQYYFGDDSAAGLKAGLARCPVRNIVMLAPANFGSPLAEMGKSWVGGIVKGTHQLGMHFFATGRRILNGLELGSDYQWQLAHRDLIRAHPYFVAGGIQVTVLVGMTGFGGIAGYFADKVGSDGTVVIAGTNLNSVKYRLLPPPTFDPDQSESTWEYVCPPLEVAHRVYRGLNHHSITDPANTGQAILAALDTGRTTAAFHAHVARLAAETEADYETQRASKDKDDQRTGTAFQQYLVHVRDEPGLDLKDFTMEFLLLRRSRFAELVAGNRGTDAQTAPALQPDEQTASVEFQKLMSRDVHPYSQNQSYRSFLIDVASAQLAAESAAKLFGEDAVPAFRLYVPDVDEHVYYDLRSLHIVELDSGSAGRVGGSGSPKRGKRPDFVYPNTTTLVELVVRRASENAVWVGLEPHKHP